MVAARALRSDRWLLAAFLLLCVGSGVAVGLLQPREPAWLGAAPLVLAPVFVAIRVVYLVRAGHHALRWLRRREVPHR